MRTMTCIEDLRRTARRRVPRQFFEYADGGSYAEETLHANRADLGHIRLRQRILVDVAGRSTRTTILGEPAALPLALAPIGLCGMQHGDGEILACRAAQEAGIPFCLSTMSICSIEDVAAAVAKPFWFQLYVMEDRGFVRGLIARAAAAQSKAPVLTVDLNQGARQLDGAPSSISALPAVAEAVGSSLEILFDSGIRSGQDVMRAIALGGRAWLRRSAY